MRPRVSAIVIFLDVRPFLAEAIESVLGQTFGSWELLLVDDGSSDGSREVAEDYAARHSGRIRVLEHEGGANRGMSASRNLGLAAAHGELVAFLDADDRWPAQKLELFTAELDRDASLAVVTGSIEFFDDSPRRHVREPLVPLGQALAAPVLLCATLLRHPPLLTTLGNTMIRRSALLAVGGFEDEFTGQAEDAVVWCKLALRCPFAAVAATGLEYRRHAGASGAADLRSSALAAGHARFARWLWDYTLRRPEETRAWAVPIVAEHLFRSTLLEAWLTPPDDPVHRRVRLVRTWRELTAACPAAATVRRRLRIAAQLAAGLRSGALSGLQEPELIGGSS